MFSCEFTGICRIACQCIAIVCGMNENMLNALLKSKMTKNEATAFALKYDLKNSELVTTVHSDTNSRNIQSPSTKITYIEGICIPILNSNETKPTHVVQVSSTKRNLKRIALGLATNKPISLIGPVGSGKTTLVEHLACKMGHTIGETFVKVQLGDQTDSKMLLGTYRCTDIPGEFVWQPGVLTQAVSEGSWLLLEDIDSASLDIASVLASLLETGCLVVPGHENLKIAPGFQLFVTQRLITTKSGHHKRYSPAFQLLEKHFLQVDLEPLSSQELTEIIRTSYPQLKTIAERLVKVFEYFSDNTEIRSARLTSTRDFFKWCSRAIVNYDVSSQQSALKILQDAIDILCCSYMNFEDTLSSARVISTQLGIISEKADYFLKIHKPTLTVELDFLKTNRANIARQISKVSGTSKFCLTRPAANLLERTMCCVSAKEPVLFVGETGTGKTTTVQYLADMIGQTLVVINMNQQSDSADLLGGFKPIEMKRVVAPIRSEFEDLFRDYFDVEQNKKFLKNIRYCFNEQKWSYLIKLIKKSYTAAIDRLRYVEVKPTPPVSEQKLLRDTKFLNRWKSFGTKLQKLESQLRHKSSLAFAFVEGSLVKAVQNGDWVLLDEINLANAETLECLSGLLEGREGSISLLECGDKKPIQRHPNFTLFACMNPSTDVGKKDLPAGLRNRFTEFFVDELMDKNDLILLVNSYLEAASLSSERIESIVKFYVNIRKEAAVTLCDGVGQKPHFSLRSLCRALRIASNNPCGLFTRSLYEAFCLSFLTQLDSKSYDAVHQSIIK